jgi:hypothetical protein
MVIVNIEDGARGSPKKLYQVRVLVRVPCDMADDPILTERPGTFRLQSIKRGRKIGSLTRVGGLSHSCVAFWFERLVRLARRKLSHAGTSQSGGGARCHLICSATPRGPSGWAEMPSGCRDGRAQNSRNLTIWESCSTSGSHLSELRDTVR